ncbi:MAG TPA: class C sortase [Candidatus Mediterraneibacter norwichensis]|nr:class C sortase [Candidatus Mediterraneibacter norwichensis]
MKKQKRKESKVNPALFLTSLLIFAAGVGIFVYPAVSNRLAERRQAEAIERYEADVTVLEPEEIEEQKARAREYNQNLAEDELHDPFLQGDQYVISSGYNDVLNYNEDGIMAYVEIPCIDVNLPIYHGTSEEVLQKGAGHLAASSLPIGGEGTHSVISAHRGLPSAKLFTDLDEMEIGDVFYIHVLDETLAYQVDQIETVEPDELNSLQVVKGRDLVTLLTCTPYAVNTHRLLVRGTRIPYEEAREIQEEQEQNALPLWLREYFTSIVVGIFFLALLITAVLLWRKRSRRKGKKRRRKG